MTITLDGEKSVVDCVVGSVHRSTAELQQLRTPSGDLQERLTTGMIGSLVFGASDTPIALRGVARARRDEWPVIDFVVTDGVQVPERRAVRPPP